MTCRSRIAALCMYSRVSGNGNLRHNASTRRGFCLRDGDRLHLVSVRQRDADGGVGEQLEPALHDGVEHGLGICQASC